MSGPAGMTDGEQRAGSAPVVLSFVALATIAVSLGFTALTGIRGFVDRVRYDSAMSAPEVDRLHCIDDAVAALTRPGEEVHLAPIDDGYLYTRTVALVYPRVRLVEGDGLPLLSVAPAEGDGPAGSVRCGDLRITVVRGG